MKKVGIVGLGKYLPKKKLTNFELEKMVDTSDEWITARTGIKERRIVSKTEATSDLATYAAKEALKNANILPQDLDLIIVATISPDMQLPATACFVQANLGAKNAFCFDVSAACAGFVYALDIAWQFLGNQKAKYALVIGAEVLSSFTDWQDRNTCVLFGDGAGAVVLAASESKQILGSYLGTDGTKADLLFIPGGGSRNPASHATIDKRMHYMKMQGNEVFKYAVLKMSEAVVRVLKKIEMDISEVSILIPHQANIRIIQAMAERLNFPLEKIYLNIERYGNMSSASTAVALCEAVEEGKIKKSDIVILDAFGAGFVWGAIAIKW